MILIISNVAARALRLGHMHLEPLRIAFATPEYVTEKYFDGGLANYLHRVAKALAGMGHDIHVLTFSEIDRAEFEHPV